MTTRDAYTRSNDAARTLSGSPSEIDRERAAEFHRLIDRMCDATGLRARDVVNGGMVPELTVLAPKKPERGAPRTAGETALNVMPPVITARKKRELIKKLQKRTRDDSGFLPWLAISKIGTRWVCGATAGNGQYKCEIKDFFKLHGLENMLEEAAC